MKKIFPPFIVNFFIDVYLVFFANKRGLMIKKNNLCFDVIDKNKNCVRISRHHNVYLLDIINSFTYYFSAVESTVVDGIKLVDYSSPRYQDVVGYADHPIVFPSFAEPLITTNQYLNFANLKRGSIVLDLGAYSGLTSIVFDKRVGKQGKVFAVEADSTNIICIEKNFALYKRISGRHIQLLKGAVWKDSKGILFSHEANMGSSVRSRTSKWKVSYDCTFVKSYTLGSIANKYNLNKIDFIKCDIEGAEADIFQDALFFNSHKPRIIIEPHIINGKCTLEECKKHLSAYGYTFKKINQSGVHLPLLECIPAK